MVFVLAAIVPRIFVVIPMMIAIVVALTVSLPWSDHTSGHQGHESNQNAGLGKKIHVQMLLVWRLCY
jgi:hypothetical protein